jgi:ubiquinone/menaquinone biosynthesis C-methylase UbiE
MKTSAAREEYDQLAPAYDRRWSSYIEATLRATLDGLELPAGGRVLDLAAGTGELARRLLSRQPGLAIVGADLSAAMLARAFDKLTGRAWSPVQADAARLPFAARSFDAVLCTSAFHLFPGPGAALAEIRRVLRPGGMLTLTDWCDDYLTCKLCSLWLRLGDPASRRAYTLRECCGLLEAMGFEVVDARTFKINWLWGLMRLEARRPLGGCG